MNNQKKYNTYRMMFPEFVYDSYQYEWKEDGLHLAFNFQMGQIKFSPKAFIPQRPFLKQGVEGEDFEALLFNIGMIELISYWKSYCSPKVIIKPRRLSESQVAFWKKLYYNGLGEFFYTNSIKATEEDFMTIQSNPSASWGNTIFNYPQVCSNGYLVPIGGGKDSVVTLELLRQSNQDILPIIMNPRGATLQCAEKAGFGREEFVEIRRSIDPVLLDLNKKGCLNGHTPFSAMLAFYTLLASYLTGRTNVALSNESSANEATIPGTKVNHQYSKSLEFENDFRKYVNDNIGGCFNYFSFLRPLSELQIAQLFSRNCQYFDVFKSCNVGSKEDIWCGHCPKCLFAYIILSPFINPETINGIFGKNMLDDENMRQYFSELSGLSDVKPFECVGTIDEVKTALTMTAKKWYTNHNLPALLQGYDFQEESVSLSALQPNHNLTEFEFDILRNALSN